MVKAGTALVIGADRPFGAEIVARLEAEGFAVTISPEGSGTGGSGAEGAGPLDLLVVNAPPEPSETRFRDLTDGDVLSALERQLFAPVAVVQAVAGRLKRGASVVLVASRAHLGGWAGTDTVAAGAALIGMARSMALEFAGQGVRVNVLAPDYAGQPWDTPEARGEIAGAVAWLARPDSAALSGETLLLDSGATLRMNEAARR